MCKQIGNLSREIKATKNKKKNQMEILKLKVKNSRPKTFKSSLYVMMGASVNLKTERQKLCKLKNRERLIKEKTRNKAK